VHSVLKNLSAAKLVFLHMRFQREKGIAVTELADVRAF
jgi:hypothetical protein